jgi:hypothetical protein
MACYGANFTFLGAFAELRKATISFDNVRPSVRPSAWNKSAPTRRIFMKFDIWVLFDTGEKRQVSLLSGKNKEYFTFLSVPRSILFRMRNISDKSFREKQNTHFIFSNSPPPRKKNRAVYEIMCKNTVEPKRPQMTIWPLLISRCVPKATDTHSLYM